MMIFGLLCICTLADASILNADGFVGKRVSVPQAVLDEHNGLPFRHTNVFQWDHEYIWGGGGIYITPILYGSVGLLAVVIATAWTCCKVGRTVIVSQRRRTIAMVSATILILTSLGLYCLVFFATSEAYAMNNSLLNVATQSGDKLNEFTLAVQNSRQVAEDGISLLKNVQCVNVQEQIDTLLDVQTVMNAATSFSKVRYGYEQVLVKNTDYLYHGVYKTYLGATVMMGYCILSLVAIFYQFLRRNIVQTGLKTKSRLRKVSFYSLFVICLTFIVFSFWTVVQARVWVTVGSDFCAPDVDQNIQHLFAHYTDSPELSTSRAPDVACQQENATLEAQLFCYYQTCSGENRFQDAVQGLADVQASLQKLQGGECVQAVKDFANTNMQQAISTFVDDFSCREINELYFTVVDTACTQMIPQGFKLWKSIFCATLFIFLALWIALHFRLFFHNNYNFQEHFLETGPEKASYIDEEPTDKGSYTIDDGASSLAHESKLASNV
eukprot:CAMPEP_0203782372 /NCGR_PEP_ID=MMETSP0099_2-20121227/10971_1 /ASSEMBLY_ACC=CAM_ASM_000209 /TAXON_ID=96639 /ORGANISM=" , Strain NY0313808BC1" /LENGTH=496 /DNA_ID=CAMNT_0050683895 /DNA_START=87 /DNA_END=1577 /DNA_ORIENTATION=-